jgi:hypothetical protein
MAELISVVPGPAYVPGTVAFFEQDARHPGGEVFIAGDAGKEDAPAPEAVEVAETPEVTLALRAGRLVKAGAESKPAVGGGRSASAKEG